MATGNRYETYSDRELIGAIRADDHAAFAFIYQKFSGKLYASAYNLLRNKQACEDIIQELFIGLWLKRAGLQIDKLRPYLFTAAKNGVLMAVRSGRAHLDISAMEELAATYMTDERVITGEARELLDRSIDSLPEKCREIFVLSRKEHLSNKEIAERLDISVKTVENQITIALRKMRVEMGDYVLVALVASFLLK